MITARKSVDTRDVEIQRLSKLYEGGQNLQSLNVNYVTETNKNTFEKLNQQIDFLNRDNQRISSDLNQKTLELAEVDGFIRDRKNMSANIIASDQKNKSLSKDVKHLKGIIDQMRALKTENQDPNLNMRVYSEEDLALEQKRNSDLSDLLDSLKQENSGLKNQIENSQGIQSAYNSDKRAYNEALSGIKTSNETLS